MDEFPAPGPEAPAPVPTCFRHPDRETYLSCSRCGRPACPDCLRSAPVGQHCVECVHEGNRGVRQPTAVFGGRLPSGAAVTWVLVGLNVLFYLVEWVYPRIVDYFDMIGSAYDPTIHQTVGVANDQWYRLLTSAFLHEPGLSGFGPAHIIFNMWALILVGPALERMLGRVRFLAVYLLSAVGGSVLFYFFAAPAQPALGASGAIFGLFGAWFVLSRRLRLDSRGIVFLNNGKSNAFFATWSQSMYAAAKFYGVSFQDIDLNFLYENELSDLRQLAATQPPDVVGANVMNTAVNNQIALYHAKLVMIDGSFGNAPNYGVPNAQVGQLAIQVLTPFYKTKIAGAWKR